MLILARHAQTGANADGLLQGRDDLELTETGRSQAAALAASLAARPAGPPALVVSSPLRRAVQTAEAFGLPVTVDERWVELDYGDIDRTPIRDVPASVWRQWKADPGWAPPGGESLLDVGARVRAACDELAALAADRDVVVVTHVSPVKAAVAWALGVGDDVVWRLFLDVAAVTRIRIAADGSPTLVAYNDTAHLSRTSRTSRT
jgi:broad specificity phosphatase PhoE